MTLGPDYVDERELLPGISVHFMVKDPPLDRMAALVQYLAPCVNEFVIVDTSDTDKYVSIMESWSQPSGKPVTVVRTSFVDFATTRNVGHEVHKYEWTLGLDPDELPSLAMLLHITQVTSKEYMDANPYAAGYCYWTWNWWDGQLGPEMPYHYHTRLYKTKGSWVYRPIHELVMVQGKSELDLRGTHILPLVGKSAFLIHSKGAEDIQRADALYREMGEVSH